MGTQLPSHKRTHPPNFRPMSVVAKRLDGSIKMPIGMEVGFVPGHIVLHGDPAPPKKGHSPTFRPMSVVAKRLDGSRCHFVRR